MNTQCGQNVELLNASALYIYIYSYHCVLGVHILINPQHRNNRRASVSSLVPNEIRFSI